MAKSASGKAKTNAKTVKKAGHRASLSPYIRRVLERVDSNIGITSDALSLVNLLANDVLNKLVSTTGSLASYGGKSTVSSRQVKAASHLIFATGLVEQTDELATSAMQKSAERA